MHRIKLLWRQGAGRSVVESFNNDLPEEEVVKSLAKKLENN
jgi:hypothetical protein